MRVSFKSFWGETLMLFPNINFWSDDDPEYAPYKRMFFIGWLWWGWRFYYGKKADALQKPFYRVQTIYNQFRDKKMYIIDGCRFGCFYVGIHTFDCIYGFANYSNGQWTFRDTSRVALTDPIRDAIRSSIEKDDVSIPCDYNILAWDDYSDAQLVCDFLCLEEDMAQQDRWKITK